jgi:hypothetical protein
MLLADSGHFSEANVQACAAAGIDPLGSVGNFVWDRDDQVVTKRSSKETVQNLGGATSGPGGCRPWTQ